VTGMPPWPHGSFKLVAGCSVFGICLMAGVAWWLLAGNRPSADSALDNGSVSCLVSDNDHGSYCERVATDVVRRASLTAEQRAAAEQAHNRVQRAVSRDDRCSPPTSSDCLASPRRIPTSADVDQRRKKLEEAGFSGSVVRIARPDDPAPHGTLLYAVPVAGGACVVGYIKTLPGGGGGGFLGGPLPNGRCLSD
jgi:hypothetical protein